MRLMKEKNNGSGLSKEVLELLAQAYDKGATSIRASALNGQVKVEVNGEKVEVETQKTST